MEEKVKDCLLTHQQKLVDKIKASGYFFNPKKFEKFQELFSKDFSNINVEELRNAAWRKR